MLTFTWLVTVRVSLEISISIRVNVRKSFKVILRFRLRVTIINISVCLRLMFKCHNLCVRRKIIFRFSLILTVIL